MTENSDIAQDCPVKNLDSSMPSRLNVSEMLLAAVVTVPQSLQVANCILGAVANMVDSAMETMLHNLDPNRYEQEVNFLTVNIAVLVLSSHFLAVIVIRKNISLFCKLRNLRASGYGLILVLFRKNFNYSQN